MPRIYIDSEDGSEPKDYCRHCWPYFVILHRDSSDEGDEHPPYEYECYYCEECCELLTEEDN